LALKPDTVAVVRDALLARPAVTAIFGARITARLQGDVWPQLRLSTASEGEDAEPHMGEARVTCECFGGGGTDADTASMRIAALTLFANARDLAGAYPSGIIVACAPLLFIPDPVPDTGRARFIVDIVVTTL